MVIKSAGGKSDASSNPDPGNSPHIKQACVADADSTIKHSMVSLVLPDHLDPEDPTS